MRFPDWLPNDWRGNWGHPAPTEPDSTFSWKGTCAVKRLATAEIEDKSFDMGDFSRILKVTGVLDNKAVDLPGSLVFLPYGVRLLERFAEIVHRFYRMNGLNEYDYPMVVPMEVFGPEKTFYDLTNKLLYVGTEENFRKNQPRAVLNPTGEAMIYAHWKRIVKVKEDLPIKMYRKARYFRPFPPGKQTGRSVFRSLEAGDVYEFHTCFATAEEAEREMAKYMKMLYGISEYFRVPMLWGIRPPWTNQADIAMWSIGGDVPLPTKGTVQISTLYNQGQIFSKAYGIRYKSGNEIHYSNHVTGCVTRRLLLAHLMLGLDINGNLFVHPHLAPDEVSIIYQSEHTQDDIELKALRDQLSGLNIRTTFFRSSSRKEINRLRKQNRMRGVPVEVLIQGRRFTEDRFKIVLTRSDTLEEATIYSEGLHDLPKHIPPLLKSIGYSYEQIVSDFFFKQCVEVNSESELKEVLLSKQVAICPLLPTEESCLAISRWEKGEVLGFIKMAEERYCVLTNKRTNALAYVSSRI
jgi:prolyl-tRNA synthetase